MSCCIFLRCRRCLEDGSEVLGVTHSRGLRSHVACRSFCCLRALYVAINSFKLLSQIYNGAKELSLYGKPSTFRRKRKWQHLKKILITNESLWLTIKNSCCCHYRTAAISTIYAATIATNTTAQHIDAARIRTTAAKQSGSLLPDLDLNFFLLQGGSNMTGTDLCVNKPHCAAAVRPWESEATTSTLPPARVRTCSVLSGSC